MLMGKASDALRLLSNLQFSVDEVPDVACFNERKIHHSSSETHTRVLRLSQTSETIIQTLEANSENRVEKFMRTSHLTCSATGFEESEIRNPRTLDLGGCGTINRPRAWTIQVLKRYRMSALARHGYETGTRPRCLGQGPVVLDR